MIEAAMFWNEPNNKSHWDFVEFDPSCELFSAMTRQAAAAVAAEAPSLPRVLGGISPIDPEFIRLMVDRGVLERLNAVAVHGFPLDWNLWQLDEWPRKLAEIRAVTELPVWVSEVGVSSFGAEEVQDFGLARTAALLRDQTPRIHWSSLFDLPGAWPATTRHREAEGSSYYRHFHMGLLREDGTPKPACARFAAYTPEIGICQWFHFEDHRLPQAVQRLRRLGVRHVRTGLSWADSLRPGALAWFDRMMGSLEGFAVTVTFCFTPESRGLKPDWNHGNAHFLRGIATELLARGHGVRVFEPADGWSLQQLLAERGDEAFSGFKTAYPQLRSRCYDPATLDLDAALDGMDVVVVHEWNPPELVARIGRHRAGAGRYRLLFHDTHHRLVSAPGELEACDLSHHDGVLAYGDLYERRALAARAFTWHEAADTRIFKPLVGLPKTLRLLGHLYSRDHNAFNCTPRAVLNINRDSMARFGFSPPTRIFEAAGAGACLLTDAWDGIEQFLTPGEEVLIARGGTEVAEHLASLQPRTAATIGRAARTRVLAEHTYAHRAAAVEAVLTGRSVREVAA